MKKVPGISDAELEVMKILWSSAPQTANEVIQALESTQDWSPKTVRTLLSRLVQKEALAVRQGEERVYVYTPLVSQEEYLKQETKSFLKRLYGGALQPFLVHFLQDKKLSQSEIAALKDILDQQEGKEK